MSKLYYTSIYEQKLIEFTKKYGIHDGVGYTFAFGSDDNLFVINDYANKKKFDILFMGVYQTLEKHPKDTIQFCAIEIDENDNDTTNERFYDWEEIGTENQSIILTLIDNIEKMKVVTNIDEIKGVVSKLTLNDIAEKIFYSSSFERDCDELNLNRNLTDNGINIVKNHIINTIRNLVQNELPKVETKPMTLAEEIKAKFYKEYSIEELQNYMHDKIIKTIANSNDWKGFMTEIENVKEPYVSTTNAVDSIITFHLPRIKGYTDFELKRVFDTWFERNGFVWTESNYQRGYRIVR